MNSNLLIKRFKEKVEAIETRMQYEETLKHKYDNEFFRACATRDELFKLDEYLDTEQRVEKDFQHLFKTSPNMTIEEFIVWHEKCLKVPFTRPY